MSLIMSRNLLAFSGVVVVGGLGFLVFTNVASPGVGENSHAESLPVVEKSRHEVRGMAPQGRPSPSTDSGSSRQDPDKSGLAQIGESYEAELELLSARDVGSDPADFSLALRRFVKFPEPYRGVLIDAIFQKFIDLEIVSVDFRDSDLTKSFFEKCDFYLKDINKVAPDGEALRKLFIESVLASLSNVPSYTGIDSFINLVNSSSFDGKEEFYVEAYVVKITGENSRPDLSAIPVSDDPFLTRKLHQSLFKVYAETDRVSALEFALADEFAGDIESGGVPNVIGAVSVHQWDSFVKIISTSRESAKISTLARIALNRRENREDKIKEKYLKELSE